MMSFAVVTMTLIAILLEKYSQCDQMRLSRFNLLIC